MSGSICIVTGANSGIGKETALGLAQIGARVVMVCRNAEKGKAALEEIRRESGSSQVDLLIADMSSQASVRANFQMATILALVPAAPTNPTCPCTLVLALRHPCQAIS
jgi:NAD(P)-dependent dehydrogenase (short-subunit alcohol dehydrogenase family)